jgi:hypothetical protein
MRRGGPERRRASRLAFALALAVAGCGEGEPSPAPITPRGAIHVEPARARVGELALLDVAVVTPPDHKVSAPRLPEAIPGFWVLGVEPLVVERAPERWIHRQRLRLRAREVGRHAFPALSVEIETQAGARSALEIEARTLEVVSVAGEFPDRIEPFGVRRPKIEALPGGFWLPALTGSAATLALLALLLAVRRSLRRREEHGHDPELTVAPDPRQQALASLRTAWRLAPQDPQAAADAAANALRDHYAGRYRRALRSRTTEEIAGQSPPIGLGEEWGAFVGALRELDAVRFRPRAASPEAAVREAIRSAAQLLGEPGLVDSEASGR